MCTDDLRRKKQEDAQKLYGQNMHKYNSAKFCFEQIFSCLREPNLPWLRFKYCIYSVILVVHLTRMADVQHILSQPDHVWSCVYVYIYVILCVIKNYIWTALEWKLEQGWPCDWETGSFYSVDLLKIWSERYQFIRDMGPEQLNIRVCACLYLHRSSRHLCDTDTVQILLLFYCFTYVHTCTFMKFLMVYSSRQVKNKHRWACLLKHCNCRLPIIVCRPRKTNCRFPLSVSSKQTKVSRFRFPIANNKQKLPFYVC
jgi:hypothetical protein